MKDFKAIEALVESSKVADDTIAIRLCADSIINFDGEIDMTGAKFDMTCEGDSCRLDGQGMTRLFRAGALGGPFDSDHDVSFDTIQFFNASGVRLWIWYSLAYKIILTMCIRSSPITGSRWCSSTQWRSSTFHRV